MKLKLIISFVVVALLSIAIYSCSDDYLEQKIENFVLNSTNDSRLLLADSLVLLTSNVEQLSIGESAPESSRVIDVYTIKGPGYINAGVKAEVRYIVGGDIISIRTYGVCSYGACTWVQNLVYKEKVSSYGNGFLYMLKVSGTLSFSNDLAAMLGTSEQYVNEGDLYFDTKL